MAAQPQQQDRIFFSKFGFNITRGDIDDLLAGAVTHPSTAKAILTVLTFLTSACVVVFLSIYYGGKISPLYLVLILVLPSCVLVLVVTISAQGCDVFMRISIFAALVVGLCVIPYVTHQPEGSPDDNQDPAPLLTPLAAHPVIHDEYEIIAQSVCTALSTTITLNGWTYAIKRNCHKNADTCEAICTSKALHQQDSQTVNKKWSCIGAVHVYNPRSSSSPSNAAKPSMGLKVYWGRGNHKNTACGPNYCCCHAQ